MKKENVEIFEDSSIVTLYDDNENPVDFYEVACVELNEKFYGLLQPVEPMEGLDDDEAIIFEIVRSEENKDDDLFIPIADEQLMDDVFTEYIKAVSDLDGCGCHDCHCDGDCDCDDECDCEEGHCDCHHHDKK